MDRCPVVLFIFLHCFACGTIAVVYDRTNSGHTTVPGDIGTDATTINLTTNSLTSIANSEFSSYTVLEILVLSDNNIASIDPDAFSGLSTLKELYLDNNQLTAYPDLNHVRTSLLVLDLAFNSITSVPSVNYYLLQVLNLAGNPIPWMDGGMAGIGSYTGSLLDLDLSYTNCSNGTHTGDLNYYFEALQYLRAENCVPPMTAVPLFHTFFTSIVMISFDWNSLTSADIEGSSLSSFTSISYLNLAHNHLTAIPDLNSNVRSSLIELNLAVNAITSLENSLLEDYTSLVILTLRGNSLTAFEQIPLLSNLANIRLQNNAISSVAAEVFSNVTSLETLNLKGNVITVFPNISSVVAGGNVTVDLTDNALVCNCSFSFVLEASDAYSLYSNVRTVLETNPCASPAALTSTPYADLTVDDICDVTTTAAPDVECEPFPTWLDIELDAGEVISVGARVRYVCIRGYEFKDGDKSKTSRCSADDGSWSPSFKWCYEKVSAEAEAAYDRPEESDHAVVIGSIIIILVVAEIAFILLLDSNHIKKSCMKFKRNNCCKRCCAREKREAKTVTHVASPPTLVAPILIKHNKSLPKNRPPQPSTSWAGY